MVNQTTEILIGISNQTGMQLNETLNMMSKYYMYKNILDLFLLFLIFVVMGLSVYLIYRYCKNKFEDDTYFDIVDLCMSIFIPNIFIFLIVVISFMVIESCILGIIFPKETMIYHMIQNLI